MIEQTFQNLQLTGYFQIKITLKKDDKMVSTKVTHQNPWETRCGIPQEQQNMIV